MYISFVYIFFFLPALSFQKFFLFPGCYTKLYQNKKHTQDTETYMRHRIYTLYRTDMRTAFSLATRAHMHDVFLFRKRKVFCVHMLSSCTHMLFACCFFFLHSRVALPVFMFLFLLAHLPVAYTLFLRVLFLCIFLLHYAYIPQKSLREAFALTHIPPNTLGKNFGVFAQ